VVVVRLADADCVNFCHRHPTQPSAEKSSDLTAAAGAPMPDSQDSPRTFMI